jgi:iron complex outermembrane receptor protein
MRIQYERAMSLALLACAVHAQANNDERLETVTVTGQALPAAITTLSNSDLRPARDTGDALRDLLGVSGSRMGGHGIDPAIRGLSQTQLNILLDGAYVHGGCPNRMDPPTSYAGAAAFQEITIIRGTQTLEYGGGGPGGTILFERRNEPLAPGESIRGQINGFWRDNDSAGELGADVTLGSEDAFLRLIAGRTDADNYRDGNGDRIRSSYTETTGGVILGYRFERAGQVELSYDLQKTDDALFPGAGMGLSRVGKPHNATQIHGHRPRAAGHCQI